jgi:hypothetical protein
VLRAVAGLVFSVPVKARSWLARAKRQPKVTRRTRLFEPCSAKCRFRKPTRDWHESFQSARRELKIPRTPDRRITPLFGSLRFGSWPAHALAIVTHIPVPPSGASADRDLGEKSEPTVRESAITGARLGT